jgi:hypothetical protein
MPIMIGIRLGTVPILIKAVWNSKQKLPTKLLLILIYVLISIPRAFLFASLRVHTYTERNEPMKMRMKYFMKEGIDNDIAYEHEVIEKVRTDLG